MNIELRHLRYFVAVAEIAAFCRAAARPTCPRAAASQQIQNLSSRSARLLARTNRSVALTAAGTVCGQPTHPELR